MQRGKAAELISTITNLKVLEVYRGDEDGARRIDKHLVDLSKRIIEALEPGVLEDAAAEMKPDPAPEPESALEVRTPDSVEELRAVVHDLGITNFDALAEDIGISLVTLNKMLTGETTPFQKTLDKVSAYLANLDRKPEKGNGETDPAAAVEPGKLFAQQVESWMQDEGKGKVAAAARLSVSRECLDDALAGKLPHSNVITRIGQVIPQINRNLVVYCEAAAAERSAH